MLEEELEEFRLALRQYMECACAQTGCLQSVYALVFFCLVFKLFAKGFMKRGLEKKRGIQKKKEKPEQEM